MRKVSRRSVLRGSVGLAAAGTLARPFIADAAVTTATVWWTQGFIDGGGRCLPPGGRGVREGQRQQNRSQPHSVRGR